MIALLIGLAEQYGLHHGRDSLGRYPYDCELERDLSDQCHRAGPVVDLGLTKVDVHSPVPEEPGVQSFIYKWGQSAA